MQIFFILLWVFCRHLIGLKKIPLPLKNFVLPLRSLAAAFITLLDVIYYVLVFNLNLLQFGAYLCISLLGLSSKSPLLVDTLVVDSEEWILWKTIWIFLETLSLYDMLYSAVFCVPSTTHSCLLYQCFALVTLTLRWRVSFVQKSPLTSAESLLNVRPLCVIFCHDFFYHKISAVSIDLSGILYFCQKPDGLFGIYAFAICFVFKTAWTSSAGHWSEGGNIAEAWSRNQSKESITVQAAVCFQWTCGFKTRFHVSSFLSMFFRHYLFQHRKCLTEETIATLHSEVKCGLSSH